MNSDCMIWKPEGVWLQTYAEDGAIRLSFCGRLSFPSVERFCQEHGIDLVIAATAGRKQRSLSYGWSRSLDQTAVEALNAPTI